MSWGHFLCLGAIFYVLEQIFMSGVIFSCLGAFFYILGSFQGLWAIPMGLGCSEVGSGNSLVYSAE